MRRHILITFCVTVLIAAAWTLQAQPKAMVHAASADPSSPDRETGEDMVIGGRDVTVWRPETEGPAPVILFSHGFGACATHSAFLTSALAGAGYLVIAPRHADAGCATPARGTIARPMAPFTIPTVWSDTTWHDRREDIVAIWEALRHDPAFADRIDRTKLAVMGHSVGGYTALGLAGAWPSWRLPDVKAVVALSPSCLPFLVPEGGLGALSAPVAFQGGTRDFAITPLLIRPRGCFDRIRGTARLVVFRHIDHYAWTNPHSKARAHMIAHARDFLDRHVRGLSPSPPLRRRRGVALMLAK